jgi:toxin ParE1/3/4
MSRIHRRRAARQDLVEIVYHYISEGTPATGRRFREVAEATFLRLAAMPGKGTRFDAADPAFGELKDLPLPPPFKKYLVFYRPVADGIEIARVLHGARDIHGILAEDFDVAGEGDDDGIEPEGDGH